ncbi:MAG TPA: ABC transporter permease subunit [Anaerolineae bacterium]|nr:ABC transporter permease subunit [Anaerolineae bacterium]
MIFILVSLVFLILRIMPGDPIRATMRPGAPKEYVDSIRHALGLDKPMFINLRGSSATVLPERLILRAEPSADSEVALLVERGERFEISDRTRNEEGEWLRVATGENFEGWISPGQQDWLRRVSAEVSTLEEADMEGYHWLHVRIPATGPQSILEGWAPIDQFQIRTNIFDSQYFNYLWNLLRLDLGESIAPVRGRPVITDLADKFPATLELSIFSMIITTLIGISTGAYAAHKRRSVADYGFRIYSIVIYAVPVFWLGLMLQLLFGVKLGWLPVYGRIGTQMQPETIVQAYNLGQKFTGPLGEKVIAFLNFLSDFYVLNCIVTRNWASLASALKHLALPSLTLGLYLSGVFTRLTRANMLGTLQEDYITAARARGIPERIVVYKHALKNAFIPILTMLGLQFALLMAGAVLTETTFSWPGMGRFLTERIEYRDFPSIQGGVVFFALLVTGVSLLVDIIYAYLDPRIRY